MSERCTSSFTKIVRSYRGPFNYRIKQLKLKASDVPEFALEMSISKRMPYEYCRDAILAGGIYFQMIQVKVVP